MSFPSRVGDVLNRIPGRYSLKMLAGGLISYLPNQQMFGLRGTVLYGIRLPASYYYSIWLRHLVKTHESRGPTTPDVVAEIGPGDALGIGIAALLPGARRYIALDIVPCASNSENLQVFDEMVAFFRARAPIPDHTVYPEAEPALESYAFPGHILGATRLSQSLAPDRLELVRRAVASAGSPDVAAGESISISYVVPWSDARALRPSSVDLILSQAVLEHVDDLEGVYRAMAAWLRPGGWISHAIDFRSHGVSPYGNGHWAYPSVLWKVCRGRRPFLLNRQPHSSHLKLIGQSGFRMVRDEPVFEEPPLARGSLARTFRQLSDSDLRTSRAFIQAVKDG